MIRQLFGRLFKRHSQTYPRTYRKPDITRFSKEEWEQIKNAVRPDFTEMEKRCKELEEVMRREREESKKQESKE